VKKGGFLSAVATGFFGLLISAVVCATGLGFYGLYLVNHNAGRLIAVTQEVMDALPEWKDRLPPVLADALNDTRAPGYREQLKIKCNVMQPADRRQKPVAIIEVENAGDRVVSMLAARVVLRDRQGVPMREFATRLVTPIQLDETDWRGPLEPRETRIARLVLRECDAELTPVLEVTELRVFSPAAGDSESGPMKTAGRG
jgi:hypothetical protein